MKKVIYDFGVHTGMDSLFYLQKGFKVIGVEANPVLVQQIKNKFITYIDTGDYILIDKAISDTSNSSITFYINPQKTDWGTIYPTWNRTMNNKFEEVTVDTIMLDKLFNDYGIPYYMKIDIEGADILVLNSLIKLNIKPTYLSIELLTPNNYGKHARNIDYLEILKKVKELGYTKFRIVDQSKHRSTKCPNPSMEGNYVEFPFTGISSGLFGKDLELTTNEISYDEIVKKYTDYFWGGSNDIFHQAGWFDIHCSN